MSVGLGTLKTVDDEVGRRIEVMASNYDADELELVAETIPDPGKYAVEMLVPLDRRQMQELSIIIDRFLDNGPQRPKPRHGKNRITGDPCRFTEAGKCTCGLYPP